jgi:hypothetical protein
MLSSADVDVMIAYRLVGLGDSEVDETPPSPREAGHPWLSARTSAVYLESAEDIYRGRMRFESWDARPPPLDEAAWPVSEVIGLSLPSGMLSVHQIAAGTLADVFDVGAPGRYHARLAWRAGEPNSDGAKPQAFVLAQFWLDVSA